MKIVLPSPTSTKAFQIMIIGSALFSAGGILLCLSIVTYAMSYLEIKKDILERMHFEVILVDILTFCNVNERKKTVVVYLKIVFEVN